MNPLNRSPRAAAPWVWTRLRTSRLAALLLAALVLGSSFLAAAFPRTLDRDADHVVSGLLSSGSPLSRSLVGRATMDRSSGDVSPAAVAAYYSDAQLTRAAQAIRGDLDAPLRPAPADQDAMGGRTLGSRDLTDPALPRPDLLPPELNLVYLQGQADHVRLVAGKLPSDPPAIDAGGFTSSYQIALPKATADRFGVTVGAVLHTASPTPDGAPPIQAVVVGIFQPTDAGSTFWSATPPCLLSPCLDSKGQQPPMLYWSVTALVGAAQLPSLTGWQSDAELFWQIPAASDGLPAHRLAQAQAVLSSALDGAHADALPTQSGVPGLHLTSMLPSLLTQAQQEQSAAAALYAIGPLGAAAVALVVLLLAAGLAGDRRRAELNLARARGGSLRGLGGRLLAESALVVLPSALAGTLLALRLLPTARWTAAVSAGAAVGLIALLAFPLRAVGQLWGARLRRGASSAGAAGGAGRRRGSRLRIGDPRRVIAELAVLAVTAAAVLAVRRRGAAAPGTSLDLLLSAAPLLLALSGAVLLARVFPLLVVPAARWARRGSGAIGFLGLARATRGSGSGHRAPTVLPLLALLLAVTTAGFGVTVLSSADAGRTTAVRQLVGGDAQVEAVRPDGLPAGFAAAAAALPGVRGGSTAVVDRLAPVGSVPGVTMVIVDPTTYSALTRSIGIGRFDPALLSDAGAAPGDPVAALATPALAARLGDDLNFTDLPSAAGRLSLKVVGTVNGSPALPGGGGDRQVLVLSGPAVLRQLPSAKPMWDAPNTWFGIGNGIEAGTLRALLTKLDSTRPAPPADAAALANAGGDPSKVPTTSQPGKPSFDEAYSDSSYTILTRAAYSRELSAGPLERSATRLFWGSVGGAAGFTVLALLLTLLRAAPERAALLARLRTMGLRPRQGVVLILIEALPQALLAALAGAAIACLTVPLLGQSIDLSMMDGAAVTGGLRLALLPVAWQALALAALATLAILAETAISGRRQINTELRAGEQA